MQKIFFSIVALCATVAMTAPVFAGGLFGTDLNNLQTQCEEVAGTDAYSRMGCHVHDAQSSLSSQESGNALMWGVFIDKIPAPGRPKVIKYSEKPRVLFAQPERPK